MVAENADAFWIVINASEHSVSASVSLDDMIYSWGEKLIHRRLLSFDKMICYQWARAAPALHRSPFSILHSPKQSCPFRNSSVESSRNDNLI